LSTFQFTPAPHGGDEEIDPVTHLAMRSQLGGVRHAMTSAEWVVHPGFYTVAEKLLPQFYTDEVSSQPAPLVAFWLAISDVPWGHHPGDIDQRPFAPYLHRCVSHKITRRHQSKEQVSLHELFYLRALLTPRRADLMHYVATYFLSIHQGKVCHLFCLFFFANCCLFHY
jgi:hypothetical protein